MKAITSEQKKEIKNKSPQNARNARSESIYELSALGLLTAICFIMCFTPIGYIKTPVLSITLMTVPVIISATVLKPRDSVTAAEQTDAVPHSARSSHAME